MDEHVILVAFQVPAETRDEALRKVLSGCSVARTHSLGEQSAWWVAEDDRRPDGSDHDSAVFCLPGSQQIAAELLNAAGLTPDCNLVKPDVGMERDPAKPVNEQRLAEVLAAIRKRVEDD